MRYLPAHVRKILHENLPGRPTVAVFPRDENEKLCAAYSADHYEVAAYYATMGTPLDRLAAAMAVLPGVYRILTITSPNTYVGSTDPNWPVRYRSPETLRPQVRVLMRDE